ncbi:MAG: FAD:protein FMN transferase [Chitinophagales bacterium]
MAHLKYFCFLLLLSFSVEAQTLKEFDYHEKLMGKAFHLTIVHEDSVAAQKAIKAAVGEIKRIEQMISSWLPNSQTTAINQNAGIKAVEVDAELFALVQRCKIYSQSSDAAFDISIQPLIDLWNKSLKSKSLPDSFAIKNAALLVNYQNIICDTSRLSIFLKEKGMAIGFGAVGKGFAAESAKNILQKMGIENALINAGGDIAAWGQQSNGKPWGIAIQHPRAKEKGMAWLEIKDQAIVTSGDYEAFEIIDGKRFSHIIDPRNGYPATDVFSVTVIAYNAELADALATAIFVLGADKGLELAEKIKGLEVLLVTAENKILNSSGLEIAWEKH